MMITEKPKLTAVQCPPNEIAPENDQRLHTIVVENVLV
jgi:hypothetical protein